MSVASRQLITRVSAGCNVPACQKMFKQHHPVRAFGESPQRATDGVYKELTEMRIRTPWIEALKKKREGEQNSSQFFDTPVKLPDRDLRPKKMSDSFTRIVRMMRRLISYPKATILGKKFLYLSRVLQLLLTTPFQMLQSMSDAMTATQSLSTD